MKINYQKLLDKLFSLIQEKPNVRPGTKSLGELHLLFSDIQTDILLAYFSFESEAHESEAHYNKALEYLVSREKMNGKVTGLELIQHGFQSGPDFKYLLVIAEKIQLDDPDKSVEEIIKQLKVVNLKEVFENK